jgi:tetratricopeptide (TPR) repeat protein
MHHHAHPDPEVALLVAQCTATLAAQPLPLPTGDRSQRATLSQVPDALTLPMPGDARRLAAVVTRLCDEQAFEQALAPAMVLARQHPDNAEFAFLAASCLQRMGQPKAALMMFAMAGLHGGEAYAAVVAFRSGECLAAMGNPGAAKLFDAAIEAARQDPRLAELQQLAQDKAESLRADRDRTR